MFSNEGGCTFRNRRVGGESAVHLQAGIDHAHRQHLAAAQFGCSFFVYASSRFRKVSLKAQAQALIVAG